MGQRVMKLKKINEHIKGMVDEYSALLHNPSFATTSANPSGAPTPQHDSETEGKSNSNTPSTSLSPPADPGPSPGHIRFNPSYDYPRQSNEMASFFVTVYLYPPLVRDITPVRLRVSHGTPITGLYAECEHLCRRAVEIRLGDVRLEKAFLTRWGAKEQTTVGMYSDIQDESVLVAVQATEWNR